MIPKFKIVCVEWNLVLKVFEYVEGNGDFHVLIFGMEIQFLSKFQLTLFTRWAHCACGRLICLLCDHQGSWETEIFKEFLTFTKIYGSKKFFFKFLYLEVSGPFALSLKSENEVHLINVQILPTTVEFTGFLLFFLCKYEHDWLRIHKLHECKQLQMIFGKPVLWYV